MGYTTEFRGSFKIDKPLTDDLFNLINGLADTRRMKRSGLDEKYGIDGEFYWEDDGQCGQSRNPKFGKIVDYNSPPKTQPSLWLQWIVNDDKQTIEWDGGEKFYHYVDWIVYLIDKILKPNGYVLNGEVDWVGEDSFDDKGTISIINNEVGIK